MPLHWPFRRHTTPDPAPRPPRDLNRLILDVAEYQDDADHDELFRRLAADATLYAAAVSMDFEGPPGGGPMTLQPGMRLEMPAVDLGGLRFALLYVNQNDPRLGERYFGIDFAEALRMVERMPGVGGLLLYSDRTAYVGVPAGEFDRLRRDYLNEPGE